MWLGLSWVDGRMDVDRRARAAWCADGGDAFGERVQRITLSISRVAPTRAATASSAGSSSAVDRLERVGVDERQVLGLDVERRHRARAAAASSASAERSPAATSSAAARSAAGSASARSRSSGSRGRCGWTSPARRARARSGTPRSRTGMFRSRDQAADHERPAGRPSGRSRRRRGCDHVSSFVTTVRHAAEVRRPARPRPPAGR